MYLLAKVVSKAIVYSFFREITVLNSERIPLYGPVIFVGNHNNQFVDASMLIAMIPRPIRFLIAEKSLKRPIIGCLAKGAGAIAVARPQDKVYRGLGLIYWNENDTVVHGAGTRFLLDVHVGDRIQLLDDTPLGAVKDIRSDYEIVLDKPLPCIKLNASPSLSNADSGSEATSLSPSASPFSEQRKANSFYDQSFLSGQHKSLLQSFPTATTGTTSSCPTLPSSVDPSNFVEPVPFTIVPRVDQSDVYEAVTDALVCGDSIGIFPEGGSHDRLELLPLKPGVAIMALTASLEGAEDVMIVPIGLTYYQANKILSRATIQVGTPLRIPEELTELYRTDARAAVSLLMQLTEENLKGCIISAPSYKALMAVRLCVTLYPPESMFIPSSTYHILYHQFSVLFAKNEKHPELIDFSQKIHAYQSLLNRYGIADHEVQQLKQTTEGAIVSFLELVFILLISLIVGLLPAILWGPIRLASSYLAEQHRKKALAASKVKITGRDVVASYKILTLMVLVPATNFIYSFIFGLWYCSTWKSVALSVMVGVPFLPCVYYYSIRYFAKIPILMRKFSFILLVLVCKLNAWRDNEKEIITCRMQMQLEVRKLVQNLGPQTNSNFMNQMERCIPEVVCNADSNRIRRRLDTGDFIPLGTRRFLEGREEIL